MVNGCSTNWLPALVLFLGVGLAGSSANAQERHIEMSSSPWQPYCGQELEHGGIFSEIVKEAYARKGYSVTYTDKPWARVMVELEEGKLDAAACAYFTDERNERYLFSNPVMLGGALAFYKKKGADIGPWKTLSDLSGYRIGVLRGSAYTPEFSAASFLNKYETNSEIQNLKKLLSNRIDLTPMDPAVAHYFITKYIPQQREHFEILPPALDEGQLVYLMMSKAVPGAEMKVETLNEGLKEIQEDGTLYRILDKYGLAARLPSTPVTGGLDGLAFVP